VVYNGVGQLNSVLFENDRLSGAETVVFKQPQV
jgi:hypothetical protein